MPVKSLRIGICILLLSFLSCMTPRPEYYARNPIEKEILRARNGKLSNLSSEGLITYDLADAQIRHTLALSRFICSVGGRRYRVCPDQPGLCRRNDSTCARKFLWICTRWDLHEEYLPQGAAFDSFKIECRSEFNPAPSS